MYRFEIIVECYITKDKRADNKVKRNILFRQFWWKILKTALGYEQDIFLPLSSAPVLRPLTSMSYFLLPCTLYLIPCTLRGEQKNARAVYKLYPGVYIYFLFSRCKLQLSCRNHLLTIMNLQHDDTFDNHPDLEDKYR